MGWPDARINQDNVIWKPPGAKPLGFHQDDAYQDWIVPSSMITCWMALDDTRLDGGTIEYVRHSNHWLMGKTRFTFHAPDDYHEGLKHAAGVLGVDDYEIDPFLSAQEILFFIMGIPGTDPALLPAIVRGAR